MSAWGSPEEIERRRRIRLAVWAYAYEYLSVSLVDDATFDREAYLVNPKMNTGNARLDRFFRTRFAPFTGQWVHSHPDKHRLAAIAKRYWHADNPNSDTLPESFTE